MTPEDRWDRLEKFTGHSWGPWAVLILCCVTVLYVAWQIARAF